MNLWPTLTALARLTFKRIAHQKGLSIATLAGLVSAIALVYAIPFYTDAVYYRILTDEITRQTEGSSRPPFAFLFSIPPSPEVDYSWEKLKALENFLGEQAAQQMGLALQNHVWFYQTVNFNLYSTGTTNYDDQNSRIGWMYFGAFNNFDEQIELVSGQMPAAAPAPGEPVEALIHEKFAADAGLQAGETYIAYRRWEYQGIQRPVQFTVRVAGIWRAADPDSTYWFNKPETNADIWIVPEETLHSVILPQMDNQVYFAIWYLVLDGQDVHAGDVAPLLQNIALIKNEVERRVPGTNLFSASEDALRRYAKNVGELTFLLYVFSVPVLGLLLAFIGLVISLSIQSRQNEMAVLRSRGAAVLQIMGMVALESLFFGVAAALLAAPVGQGVAQLVGRARSFLDFSLPNTLRSGIDGSILWLGLAAVGVVIAAQALPVLGSARHTIISYKRERARDTQRPLWQRMWLDVLLLIPTVYGAYLLTQQGSLVTTTDAAQYNPLQNPLLLLIPAFGILAATLFLVRLLPFFMGALTWALAKTRSISLLMAVRYLARTPRFYTAPLILLIMTLSLSIYTATLAQTLDQALYDQAYYQHGADLRLVEMGAAAASTSSFAPAPPAGPTYFFLPTEKHLDIPGVAAVTRVGQYSGYTNLSGGPMLGPFIAIDRAAFPSAAFWRYDFARQSLGTLLNQLAQQPNGVLVHRGFLEKNLLSVGQPLTVRVSTGGKSADIPFTILAAVDYFPTWYPEDKEGDYTPLFVGNLEYIFEQLEGVYPYEVWLRVTDEARQGDPYAAIVQEANLRGLGVVSWNAPQTTIQAQQQLPQRQGLFGVLSVGFLVAALFTVLGFLIYWIFTFQRRFVELGILQAIGLSGRQMTTFLACELGFLTLTGAAAGTGLGAWVSYFFIPFIQMRQGAGAVPPYLVEISWAPVLRIYLLFGLLFLAALAALVMLLRRMKIFTAIKLGETI